MVQSVEFPDSEPVDVAVHEMRAPQPLGQTESAADHFIAALGLDTELPDTPGDDGY